MDFLCEPLFVIYLTYLSENALYWGWCSLIGYVEIVYSSVKLSKSKMAAKHRRLYNDTDR